jgi:hypothetical protein
VTDLAKSMMSLVRAAHSFHPFHLTYCISPIHFTHCISPIPFHPLHFNHSISPIPFHSFHLNHFTSPQRRWRPVLVFEILYLLNFQTQRRHTVSSFSNFAGGLTPTPSRTDAHDCDALRHRLTEDQGDSRTSVEKPRR